MKQTLAILPYLLIIFFFASLKNQLSHQALSLDQILPFAFELMLLTPIIYIFKILQIPSIQKKITPLITQTIPKYIPQAITLAYAFLITQFFISMIDDRLQPLFKDQSLIPLILKPLSLSLIFLLFFSIQALITALTFNRVLWMLSVILLLIPWVYVSYPALEIFFSLYSMVGLWIFVGFSMSIIIYESLIQSKIKTPIKKYLYPLVLLLLFSQLQDQSFRQYAYKHALVLKILIDQCNRLTDQDKDGYGTFFGMDCDDQNPSIHPAEIDWPQTKVKEDCSTLSDEEGSKPENQIDDLLPMPEPKILQTLSQKQPNILLISIDTLRSDHLQNYGYALKTTPFLAEMKDFYWQIESAYSPSNATKYSLSSMLTALPYRLIPFEHAGIKAKFSPQTDTMFKTLKTLGWHTQAHLPQFFTQGLIKDIQSHFDVLMGYGASDEIKTIDSDDMVARTKLAIQKQQEQEQAWAFWLHLVDPHEPYICHDPQSSMSCYDQEILKTDQLLRKIMTPALLENTIVIITADHGEEFDEHGDRFHHHQLFEESIKVPLLIFHPYLSLYPSLFKDQSKVIHTSISLHNLYPLLMQMLSKAPITEETYLDQTQKLNMYSNTNTEQQVSNLQQAQNNHVKKMLNPGELLIAKNNKKSIEFQEFITHFNSRIFSELNKDIFAEHFEGFDQPRNRKIALIEGDFKAIFDIKKQELFLFNLKKDPLEKQDVSKYFEKNILQIKYKMQNYLQRELDQQLQLVKKEKVKPVSITEQSHLTWQPYPKPKTIVDGIELMGAKLEKLENSQDEPGSSQYILRLYWHKTGTQPLADYMIELEWRNQSKHKLLFKTSKTRPVSGLYPTFLWQKDELIEDAYYFKTKTAKALESTRDLQVRLSIQKNQKPKEQKVIELTDL